MGLGSKFSTKFASEELKSGQNRLQKSNIFEKWKIGSREWAPTGKCGVSGVPRILKKGVMTAAHPYNLLQCRAVASLTVPGGQEFHFPHFFPKILIIFFIFLKLFSFSSSFWLSGWATRPPGKALAAPLLQCECPLGAMILLSSTQKN